MPPSSSLPSALVAALLVIACRQPAPASEAPISRPLMPLMTPTPTPMSTPVAAADQDGDGVADADDKCPHEAEDHDNFEDDDGCPDLDNDGDGIDDVDDQCPNEPRVMGPDCQFSSGCPDDCRPPQRVEPG